MRRRSVPPVLPVALLFCGAVLSVASARAQTLPEPAADRGVGDAVPDHTLGAAAWPGLPEGEQEMVEAVAREVWAETGADRASYDRLPEVRKAALRGTAMRRLGLRPQDVAKVWV